MTKVMECSDCGHQENYTVDKVVYSATVKKRIKDMLSSSQVAKGADIRAVANEACPKCSHPTARYHSLQIRSADEPETIFFECEGCRHKWRV